jgi:hypothetical protein
VCFGVDDLGRGMAVVEDDEAGAGAGAVAEQKCSFAIISIYGFIATGRPDNT